MLSLKTDVKVTESVAVIRHIAVQGCEQFQQQKKDVD